MNVKMRIRLDPSCSDSSHQFHVLCIKLLLLLIGHRILRKLNSTGDKYAHLPDIAGWLKENDSKVGMTLLLLAGKLFKYDKEYLNKRKEGLISAKVLFLMCNIIYNIDCKSTE